MSIGTAAELSTTPSTSPDPSGDPQRLVSSPTAAKNNPSVRPFPVPPKGAMAATRQTSSFKSVPIRARPGSTNVSPRGPQSPGGGEKSFSYTFMRPQSPLGSRGVQSQMSHFSVKSAEIIEKSKACAQEVEEKMQQKAELIKEINNLKQARIHHQQAIHQLNKKIDAASGKTVEFERKLKHTRGCNSMAEGEINRLQRENIQLQSEVEELKNGLNHVEHSLGLENDMVAELKGALPEYRKAVQSSTKEKQTVAGQVRTAVRNENLMRFRFHNEACKSTSLSAVVSDTLNYKPYISVASRRGAGHK